MNSSDSYFQCILWCDSPLKKIGIYRLDTLTYGTTPASFLAIRSMQQLAQDEKLSYPVRSHEVFRDFYVNDLITGGDSVEVWKILEQTRDLLANKSFHIRKW